MCEVICKISVKSEVSGYTECQLTVVFPATTVSPTKNWIRQIDYQ